MFAEAPVMIIRLDSVIMLSTGGVTGPLTGRTMGRLAVEMAGMCVDVLASVFTILSAIVMIPSEGIESVSYVTLSEEIALFCSASFRC